ncbi:lipopolysaccharide-induced tumor necrosis factor-alpha factor homolog isoform X2 [Protopterus annectens]|uniref:lipopolysaccharide-induced tumor necrosis factor-alpha factor homolog isoform X2 n=1 Tax=Protopterus annectens TaxID=7888 RepID=UPI001CFB24D4|nr:lipopolysaccharide-induced tumor necrosis factor-alpha factor homolog isoform X2 [Protopterus annectens]
MAAPPYSGTPYTPPSYEEASKIPPHPGYPLNPGYQQSPGYPAPPQPVTVQTVIVQPAVRFGDHPVQMTCPSCQQAVVTSVSHRAGLLTWLSCGGLVLFGCVFGCCLIPFCIDSLQDADHQCPNCHTILGTYKPL